MTLHPRDVRLAVNSEQADNYVPTGNNTGVRLDAISSGRLISTDATREEWRRQRVIRRKPNSDRTVWSTDASCSCIIGVLLLLLFVVVRPSTSSGERVVVVRYFALQTIFFLITRAHAERLRFADCGSSADRRDGGGARTPKSECSRRQ